MTDPLGPNLLSASARHTIERSHSFTLGQPINTAQVLRRKSSTTPSALSESPARAR